ncbi:MAG: Sialic acid transporter (permease) NanT, partial [Myxococcaceae bacterium]|nr:Sialic acid transporter (permease) NanT [Myxococcaceae bacterium]
ETVHTRRFPMRLFLFAFFGWTFDFYDLVLLGFLKEHVGKDLHLSHSTETWMLGVALGTSGLGGIVAGALADRHGKRTMLAVTIGLYSLGSLVCGLAPDITVFLIGRGLVGLGVGGEWAIGHGMLAEAVGDRHRGRAAAALQSGEPVGVALAALVGFLVMPLIGWRAVLIVSSITGMLALVARRSAHLPNEPAPQGATFKQLVDAKIFSTMFRAWLLGVFKLGTYWTCYTWLPTFLIKEMHQSIGRSVTWVLTAQVGQLLGMLSFGWMSDRVGRRPAFSAYSVLTALALLPLVLAWEWLSNVPALFWMAMFFLGVGSGCTAGFGALLAELYPTEIRGLAMGTTYNLARAAQLGAPILVATMVAHYGLAGGLSVPVMLAIATASWVWMLPETFRQPLRSIHDE